MFVSDTLIEPLNPDVSLNHLSPAQATQIEISRNVILAVFGVSGFCVVWPQIFNRPVRRLPFGIYLLISGTTFKLLDAANLILSYSASSLQGN